MCLQKLPNGLHTALPMKHFCQKRLSSKLIKPLDVTTSLWEIPGTEKQVKAHHMAGISQIQTGEFYRTNEPVSSTNKWQEKNSREEELAL